MSLDDDTLLTRHLDGELDRAETEKLKARLAAEPALARRLEELKTASLPFRAAFDALAEQAPVERMTTRFEAAIASRIAPARRVFPWPAAAAAALGLLVVGGVLGRLTATQEEDTWRAAVADYMELYTAETFAESDASTLQKQLTALSDGLKLKLDPGALVIAGLAPRRAEILQYDGAPLGQIGYVDADRPIALCIIDDGEPDSGQSVAERDGLSLVFWAKGGRGYLAIGKAPAARLAAFAEAARAQLN